MRRILPIAIATAVLVAAFAGVASARLTDAGSSQPAPAPFDVPAKLPTEDATHPGAYGYRTSDAIAAKYQDAAPASASHSGGASATVTVTATVLPIVFLVVDESGDVVRIATNSPDRDANEVLFVARVGSETGEPRALDAALWTSARPALAEAHAGTGTIWTA